MPIDRRGTSPIPLNFYHMITVITSTGNGNYANKGRGAFLSATDTRLWRHVYRRVRDIEIQLNRILRGRARGVAYKKNDTIFLLGIPAFDIVSYVTAMTLFSCATHVTYSMRTARPQFQNWSNTSSSRHSVVIYSISAVTQSPPFSSHFDIKLIYSFILNRRSLTVRHVNFSSNDLYSSRALRC